MRVALAAAACLLAGCGGANATPRVWLVDGHESTLGMRGELAPVPRERARTPARALAVLLLGPTTPEGETGLTTGIPRGTLVESVAVADGTARVRLAGGGDLGVYGTAQVVYTLTDFPAVDRVVLTLDGRPCCLYRHSGRPVRGPLTRDDFRGWQGAPEPTK